MSRACSCSLSFAALLASVLAVHGEDAKKPHTDLYGDPLPPGAVARLGPVRLRHANAEVVFSKDGKQLISCDRRGDVRTWDVATGKLARQKRLPWADENVLDMWAVALSPDGTLAAGWFGEMVSICDTNTGKERGRMPSFTFFREQFVLTFSPDSKFLAVQAAGDGPTNLVQIWDVATVKKCRTFKNPPDIFFPSLVFTPDGRHLAGIAPGDDGSAKLDGGFFDLFLWDTTTGKLISKREGFRQLDADALAFSPDGKTLAVGGRHDQVVRLFDADTLNDKKGQQAKLATPGTLDSLAYSPDGLWLAAVYRARTKRNRIERGIILWDLATGKEARRLPARSGTEIVFAPDGKTLASHDAEGSGISLWDTATGELLLERPGHDLPVVGMAASPDGKILASGDADGMVRLWDTATSKQLRVLDGRPLNITNCRFSSDGKRVLAAGIIQSTAYHVFDENAGFQVWDVATGKTVRRIEMKTGVPLYTAALCGGGTRLAAVAGDGDRSAARLLIWDLASGKQLSERPYKFEVVVPDESRPKEPPAIEVHAAFAPDGERIIVWLGDRVGLEEVATGCLLAKLSRNVGPPFAFSPDGRLLAALQWKPRKGLRSIDDFRGLALIETASGQEIFCLRPVEMRQEWRIFERAAFTLDGRRLFAMDQKHLIVWDTDTGAKLSQRQRPDDLAITSESGLVYFSPLVMLPSDRLATGMTGGDVLVWNLAAAIRPTPKPADELDKKRLEELWSDLAGDARKAHRALYLLGTAPAQSMLFLKNHVRPTAVDTHRVAKLLVDLDSESFTAREAAVRELTRLHYRVEPMLRRALQSKPSLEMRRRLETILAGPKRPLPEDLRTLRGIAVLEPISTPEARSVLEKLSNGALSPETRAARSALQRLKRRGAWAKERSSP